MICVKYQRDSLAFVVTIEVAYLCRWKDNPVPVTEPTLQSRLNKAKLPPFAIRELQNKAYLLVLPVTMNKSGHIDVHDKTGEWVTGKALP